MAVGKEPMVITDKEEMRKWSRAMRSQGKLIALVPTMGFLHQGHLSLVQNARNHSHVVAVSIYLNPSQFSPSEDLSTYPSDFAGDIQKLASLPRGVVFHPHNLYHYGEGDAHETWVRVENIEKGLCGKSRPVFFRGVTTIVTKLFNIVEPDVAVFGKKDHQQWRVMLFSSFVLFLTKTNNTNSALILIS